MPVTFRTHAPLLFLNATDVFTGEIVVLSPVARMGRPARPARAALDDGGHLTLAHAMVMSARFPVVSPPGRYVEAGETKQIVDGGYSDNSGIETLTEVLEVVRPRLGARPLEVISFAIIEDPAVRVPKGTFDAPVAAFMAAWSARRQLTAERFCFRWRARFADGSFTSLQPFVHATEVNFTVSWFLNEGTFAYLEDQIDPVDGVSFPFCRTDGAVETRFPPLTPPAPKY